MQQEQEAAITPDALSEQSFTGTVKKTNPTGTNIEILSGLTSGDAICNSSADSIA